MHAEVELLRQELEPLILAGAPPRPDSGAVVEFTGTVRDSENGTPISALIYEAYEPMAQRVALALLQELAQAHPVRAASMRHRLGPVPVGAAAIHLRVESAHRAEAFAFAAAFMDRLKQDVPIWKTGSLP